MLALGSLAFASPWLLAALAALPVIWWLLRVTPPPLQPVRAVDARAAVQALQPKPWPSDRAAALKRLKAMPLPQGGAALWIGDGIDEGGAAPLAAYLARQGELRYLAAAEGDMPRLLAASGSASEMAGRDVSVVVRSLPASGPQALTVRASAEDGALLARESATIAPDEANVAVRLPLPTELRNRVTRIEIEGEDSAGAVLLVDERWRRRPVGIAAAPNTAGQPLLSENYYLERALGPFTEVRRGSASDLLMREIE